ncbi:MAG: hypothetical protein J2P41_20175, partial [Blastocatellia bacterium]|nr:hypothetical protein [Blastocatellia bacterium]
GGEFRLQGVTKGKYAVVARTDEGVEGYSDPVYCEVDESDVNGIEIRIRQGGTMSGVVVIEGTNDPKVLAKLSTIQLSFSTKTEGFNGSGTSTKVGSDGSFVVGGLRPGKVTIYPYTRTITPLNFTLLRLEHDGEVQPDGITIGPGEKVANVRVVVGDNALKIHGEVKIVNGTLPKNMRLYLRANRTQQQPMGRSFTAEVDPLGRFILENLSAGEYELHVAPILTPGDPIDPHIQSAFSMAAGQKVIVSGDDQPAITITVDLNQQEGKQ